jgi:hypothetical protein
VTNAKSVQLGACFCLLWPLFSKAALAEGGNTSAQLLFEQGRDLLEVGNIEEACPKLEQSVRLEVATGALLALAMCHEKAGKLATAWAEYKSVVERAAEAGQAEREQWASERVTTLRPLLSTLNIQITAELARVPGLQVWRDESLVAPQWWNVAVPLDGGTYRLKVTAPAHEPWEETITVRQQGDAQRLEVPLISPIKVNDKLSPLPSSPSTTRATPLVASPRGEVASAPTVGDTSSLSASQWWGVGLVGASLASFATSGVMLHRATTLSGKSDSALAWGNGATYFAVGGGALAAVGAGLLIFGGHQEAATATSKLRLEVSPTALAVGLGTSF